jgi:TolB protein
MKHRPMITLLIVLFCVSLLQLACSETTQPTPPPPVPRVYKIAFSLDASNNENNEIYTVNPDGTEIARLTNTPATSSNGNPIWSPDGMYIYYKDFMDEANEIIRMDSDGNHKVNLTQYPGLDRLCDISSDGTRMAFVSDRENSTFNIFVMNLDSMTTTRITDGEPFYGRSIEFTPDGQRLLYSVDSGANYDLCLEGIDGTGKTILSNLTRDDTYGVVSPDGQRIAYLSQLNGAPQNDIWVCSLDGNNRTQITTSTNEKFEPCWSPNSREVIFTEMLVTNTTCINVVSADGSELVCLTDSTAVDHAPEWSPDGSTIAYISGQANTSELFVMNSDGSDKFQITNTFGSGRVYYLSWSPGL